MKNRLEFTLVFFLSLFLFSLLAPVSAQTYISEVLFQPPEPQPGGELRLAITLFPSAPKGENISIRLITYSDLDGDWMIEKEKNEVVEHPVIIIQDNQKESPEDEEPLDNEILVLIYKVPQDFPPQKYVALVTFEKNKETLSASILILVPRKNSPILPSVKIGKGVEKIFKTSREAAREVLYYVKEKGPLEHLGRQSGLDIYTLQDKTRSAIIDTKQIAIGYFNPVWSGKGDKIAFFIEENDKRSIAWRSLADKQDHIVATTIAAKDSPDQSLFWTPDDQYLLFLVNKHLQAVTIETSKIVEIGISSQIDQILWVTLGNDNTISMIFTAPNPYTRDTKEIYLLQLDNQLKEKSITQLVNDSRWYLASKISPDGENIVYCNREGRIFLSSTAGDLRKQLFQETEKLLEGEGYYQPTWSPDGQKIACGWSRIIAEQYSEDKDK